ELSGRLAIGCGRGTGNCSARRSAVRPRIRPPSMRRSARCWPRWPVVEIGLVGWVKPTGFRCVDLVGFTHPTDCCNARRNFLLRSIGGDTRSFGDLEYERRKPVPGVWEYATGRGFERTLP